VVGTDPRELIRTNSVDVAGVVRRTLIDYMIDTFLFIRLLNPILSLKICFLAKN